MFVEEAAWVRRGLKAIELPEAATVLNVGSSTEEFRTVEQPHIEREVLAPLRSRGARITHLDMKKDEGVDIVCDLTDPTIDPRCDIGEPVDLVLATGLLQHFEDVRPVAAILTAMVGSRGYLLVTTPGSYRMTEDPIDHGYRPSPEGIVDLLRDADPELRPVTTESVRIKDRRYYKGLVSRASKVPVGSRWIALPGASEQVRRLVPPLRWRESCVLLQRPR